MGNLRRMAAILALQTELAEIHLASI